MTLHRSRRSRLFIASVVIVITALVSVAVAVPTFAVPKSKNSCPDVELIRLRGSGEPKGKSRTIETVNEAFIANTKLRHKSYELDYPAKKVPFILNGSLPTGYADSVDKGIRNLNEYMMSEAKGCPNLKFVLTGYSQGSHVIGIAVDKLPQEFKGHIAGIALLGDPRFDPSFKNNFGNFKKQKGIARDRFLGFAAFLKVETGAYVKPPFDSITRSYCLDGDPVCNISIINGLKCLKGMMQKDPIGGDKCAHHQYIGTKTSDEAGKFLADSAQAAMTTR